MGFKDLELNKQYDSEEDDILNSFYVPVLSESIEYFRVVGFFTSSSLSCVARGLKKFIEKNGKIKLVCGSYIPEEDVKAIIKGEKSKEKVLSDNFIEELKQLDNDENEFDIITKNGVEILAWMVKHDLIDIKVAVKLDENGNPSKGRDGELHYKIGIFNDGTNYMSTNGSDNFTAFGLTKNWEHFDVYKSWDPKDYERFQGHVDLFMRTWEGKVSNYEILNIPEAAERELIARSPPSMDKITFIEDMPPKPTGKTSQQPEIETDKPTLFDYQITARDRWLSNNKRGIFAMATGTGKTYTALGCLEEVLNEEENLVAIIVPPYMHLVSQWKESVVNFGLKDKFDKIITVDSSNPKGMEEFHKAVDDVDSGFLDNILVFTTHDSYWRPNFIDFIKSEEEWDCKFFIIADEMHGLGSYNRQKGLIPEYDYRLGLSATPTRHFDEVGTDRLMDYFGGEVYSFDLYKALHEINPRTSQTYLTPYIYNVYAAHLSLQELSDYEHETRNIRNSCHGVKKGNKKSQKSLEMALNRRADILKKAEDKFDVLRDILKDLIKKGPEYYTHLLIYCNDKEQLGKVVSIAGNEFDLSVKTFTGDDSAKPDKFTGKSKRDDILEDFDEGDYDVLAAIKCLDEGVDVPSASNAILMCSSTNPREFIQRIGRVIRRDEGKTFANISDIAIKPSGFYPKFRELENKIEEKEEIRIDLISDTAFEVNFFD